jgi:hypothetical protein
MHFKHLQRLQWQLSEQGIFCAKAFLQADAALNSGMTSGSGSFEWTTGPLQGELTHEVSWFSKGADVPTFDGQQLGVEVLFYLKRVA